MIGAALAEAGIRYLEVRASLRRGRGARIDSIVLVSNADLDKLVRWAEENKIALAPGCERIATPEEVAKHEATPW